MLRNLISRYHAEDDGTGSGGAGDDQGNVKPSDILARYGQTAESALRMAEKLSEAENNNYRLREKNRTLRQETADLKGKTPADGARVLTADEAKAFDAFIAIGKPAAEIASALTAAESATGELARVTRETTIRDAATAHGYAPAALVKLPSLAGKAITLKDEQADGKPVRRAYVAEDGKETALDAYIQAHDPEFLPSLAVTSVSPPSPTAPRGTAFVQQHTGAGGTGAGDRAEQFIRQQAEARAKQINPLMKPQGA